VVLQVVCRHDCLLVAGEFGVDVDTSSRSMTADTALRWSSVFQPLNTSLGSLGSGSLVVRRHVHNPTYDAICSFYIRCLGTGDRDQKLVLEASDQGSLVR
jgi:hypothetical protein